MDPASEVVRIEDCYSLMTDQMPLGERPMALLVVLLAPSSLVGLHTYRWPAPYKKTFRFWPSAGHGFRHFGALPLYLFTDLP